MSSSKEDSSISISTIDKDKKNISNHPYSPDWKYFTRDEKNCDELAKLENHLANHCTKADSTIIRKFLTRILSNNLEKDESNKKRKSNSQEKLNQY
ncbi:6276_t:CDS:2, partial [Cetraspora pellucida]